jgi:peptide deformylase
MECSGEQTGNEGCLSVPGKHGTVTRPSYVKVMAYDENLQPFELEASELLARAICHELDHLEGRLYIEHVEGELRDNTEDDEEETENQA